jgi:Ni,Fe-hydrogenase III small subunit/Pyruvate/2-oxoacid:ferredoxin oxidoreductase delta subunit
MNGFKSLRVRVAQGTQYITDLRKAVPTGFRGRPTIQPHPCATDCRACQTACPTGAIRLAPVALDLGRCVFCNACAEICPQAKFDFGAEPRMAGSTPSELVIEEGAEPALRVRANATFSRLFGRSLKMRQVSAGGCNACELELGALANVNFDVQRFGIEWVASPRHADALVLTGPLTRAMHDAVRLAWDAMPEPRFLVAVGACAISGGLYEGAEGVDRSFLQEVGPVLYVAGCPPHPLTFINAILDLLGAA